MFSCYSKLSSGTQTWKLHIYIYLCIYITYKWRFQWENRPFNLHNMIFPFKISFIMGSSLETAAAGQDFAKCAIRGVPCTVVNPQTGALRWSATDFLGVNVVVIYRIVELDFQIIYFMFVIENGRTCTCNNYIRIQLYTCAFTYRYTYIIPIYIYHVYHT